MLTVALLTLLFINVTAEYYVTTEVGRDTRLICSWTGLDDPNVIQGVRWFKKRKRIQQTKRIMFDRNKLNFTMIIKDVRLYDAGVYSCEPKTVVKNMNIKDGIVRLTVLKPKIPDSPKPSILSLRVGSSALLRCNYAKAVEIYKLKSFWTRNNLRFLPAGGDKFKINNRYGTRFKPYTMDGINYLNITNVVEGIDGNYSCNYRYADGRKFSMSYVIKVYKPEERVNNVTWPENISRGMLRCNISGIRDVTSFHWEKDGQQLSSSAKYNITEVRGMRYILINNVRLVDAGVYRCVVKRSTYDIGLKFRVTIEKDMKDFYYSEWTPFSVCDSQNKKHRFRVCKNKDCLMKYGNVYEYNAQSC